MPPTLQVSDPSVLLWVSRLTAGVLYTNWESNSLEFSRVIENPLVPRCRQRWKAMTTTTGKILLRNRRVEDAGKIPRRLRLDEEPTGAAMLAGMLGSSAMQGMYGLAGQGLAGAQTLQQMKVGHGYNKELMSHAAELNKKATEHEANVNLQTRQAAMGLQGNKLNLSFQK